MLLNKRFSRFGQILQQRLTRHFYDWKTRSDTIFAPATCLESEKGSPLGIIRVSGDKTFHVLKCMTKLFPERDDNEHNAGKLLRARYAKLSKIYDAKTNELIDVGLVLWFPNPNSYTGEDTCEFHLHGSRAIMTKVMESLGHLEGLRPAEPGEFTKRAVRNNKMSLIQAESLSELIGAETDQQRRLALQGLTGKTVETYNNWIGVLVRVLAHLEASIDFGEDELIGEDKVLNECFKDLDKLHDEMKHFVNQSSQCRDFIQTGARVAILGPPNAGKSTLMNMLCRRDKSIVSELSGTTRDVIEHSMELGGHHLTLLDTAGLRELEASSQNSMLEQHNSIEREGMRRALEAAKRSNLILYLVDASDLLEHNGPEKISREFTETLSPLWADNEAAQPAAWHLIVNKIDLLENSHQQFDQDIIDGAIAQLQDHIKTSQNHNSSQGFVEVSQMSCKTNKNFDALLGKISAILERLLAGSVVDDGKSCSGYEAAASGNLEYVNERHLSLLRAALRHLDEARGMNMRRIDELAQHVRESVDYLSRISGRVTNEQVIDVIFRDFCIGK